MRILTLLRSPRRRLAALAVVALATLLSVSAFAYLSTTTAANSSGAGLSDSLPTGNAPSVSVSGQSVTVTVTQNSFHGQNLGAMTGGGYKLLRYASGATVGDGSGVTPASACNSTISGSAATLNCTETGVTPGSYQYTVKPVLNSWVGTESSFSATATVAKLNQAISFSSTAPSAATVNGPTYTVTANGGASGNPVTFTIDNTSSSVCSISGAVVSFNQGGTCTIDANQAGNGTYNAAPQVQQSFSVAKASQTVSFGSTPPTQPTPASQYTVSASSTSGLTVALTIDPTSTSICSISGTTVTFNAAGTCTIDANQAGNNSYSAAPQVQQAVVVKIAQSITFSALANKTFNQSPITVSATASSGLAVAFTSSTTSVCTVSGASVTFVTVGTCTIKADQAGDATHWPAGSVSQSFTISQGTQTITFGALANKTFDQGPITVSATASSGLAVTFSSTTTSICTVSGTSVTFVTVGTCTVKADQGGNSNWSAAPSVSQSFSITQAAQAISFSSNAPSNATVGGATYTATANGGASGNAVTFSSGSTSICTSSGTNGSVFTFVGAGTCIVRANQLGNTNYSAAPQQTQSFTVSAAAATLTISSVVRDGGNKKVHFTGTGAVATTTITVTICTVNFFPCAAPVATSTVATPTAGSWTSAQDVGAGVNNGQLTDGIQYYAQAVQGSTTSTAFPFTVTGL